MTARSWRSFITAHFLRSFFTAHFLRSLAAVLAGNAIYFGVQRWLPLPAQHVPFRIDWGLAIDFWICLACYGAVRMIRISGKAWAARSINICASVWDAILWSSTA